MKKTVEAVKIFLAQVESDKVTAEQQLIELQAEKELLDSERREISKAVVRFEVEGDQVSAEKLAGELAIRIQKIGVIDSKVAAYQELTNNYQDEAEAVYALAAKECFVENAEEILKQQQAVEKKRKEVAKYQQLLEEKVKEQQAEDAKLKNLHRNERFVVGNELGKIKSYLPKPIQDNMPSAYEPSKSRDALQAYYDENLKDTGNKEEPKKLSLIDKLLKR